MSVSGVMAAGAAFNSGVMTVGPSNTLTVTTTTGNIIQDVGSSALMTAQSIILSALNGAVGPVTTNTAAVLTQASNLMVTALNDVNVQNTGNLTLGLSSAGRNFWVSNAGSLTTAGNVTAGGTLGLYANGGAITVSSGTSVATLNNGNITLQGDGLTIAGSVNAGTGTVTVAPYNDLAIAIGDTSGTLAPFDLTASSLSNITAGNLVIGNASFVSGMTLTGNVDVSALYNLNLQTGGNYEGAGYSINLGSNSLIVSVGGSLDTGAITGNSNSSVSLTTIGTYGTPAITQQSGTTVAAGSVSLLASAGEIGSPSAPINTAANNLSATATAGDVYLASSQAVSVGQSKASGTRQLQSAGDITTVGDISADALNLSLTSSNGNDYLNSNVTGTTSVTVSTLGCSSTVTNNGTMSAGAAPSTVPSPFTRPT